MQTSTIYRAVLTLAWGQISIGQVVALSPEQVFAKASPSVVMVYATDKKAKGGSQGSGVVVSPGRVATNCHVLLKSKREKKLYQQIAVKQGDQLWPAQFVAGKLEYDTCLLAVADLPLPAVYIANTAGLRVGQRVYAIGAPSGLEFSLTDGLLSALRIKEGSKLIQTSAAISPGSSGGGLFDQEGNLIGITTFQLGTGTGLNFAYFADPILSLVTLSRVGADGLPTREAVASSVQAVLHKAVSDNRPSVSSFRLPVEASAWIEEMSRRLEQRLPSREYRIDFLRSVHYESTRAGLDPQLILGLIQIVSEFRKYDVAKNDARGYMHVQLGWVHLIGRPGDSLFDLRTNLRYGCTILRYYLDVEQGDLYRALLRYERAMAEGPGSAIDEATNLAFPNKVRAAWENQWAYVKQDRLKGGP